MTRHAERRQKTELHFLRQEFRAGAEESWSGLRGGDCKLIMTGGRGNTDYTKKEKFPNKLNHDPIFEKRNGEG